MGLKLCKREDGLVKLVREELHAVLIRVPQETYQPMAVLVADHKDKLVPPVRGQFSNFLIDKEAFALNISDITPTRVANISGKETIQFDTKLGIKILEGYLKGFLGGLGLSVPSFTFEISASKTLSYTFQEVFRLGLDHGALGDELSKHQLNIKNPAVKPFLGEKAHQMLLIDQIFVSKEFSITFQTENQAKLDTELDAMVEEIGSAEANLAITRSTSNTVSFKGDNPLPFAFSCIKVILDEEGYVDEIPQAALDMLQSRSASDDEEIPFEHQLIGEEIEMVDL